jgi:hypothetical protein
MAFRKWKNSGNCGLVNIDHTKGMFALFYDESESLGYKGVIQHEEANQVSVSPFLKMKDQLLTFF